MEKVDKILSKKRPQSNRKAASPKMKAGMNWTYMRMICETLCMFWGRSLPLAYANAGTNSANRFDSIILAVWILWSPARCYLS